MLACGITAEVPAQQELLDFGNSLLNAQRYKEAEVLFNAVILNYPELRWQRLAKLGRSQSLLGLGDTLSAVKILMNLSNGIDDVALKALLNLTSLNDSTIVAEANLKVSIRFPEVDNRRERLLSAYRTFKAIGDRERCRDVLKVLASDYTSIRRWAQLELAELYLEERDLAKVILLTSRYPDEDKARLLKAKVYLLKGDTLSAIESLSESRMLPNLKLLARIHRELQNFDAVLRTLSRFPDTLTEVSDLKTTAMLELGMRAQLEDLIPYLRNELLKSKVYLSLGYPDSALKILSTVEPVPESLLVQVYLWTGDIFSAWSVWKRGFVPPRLSKIIASKLDSLGYYELAVEIWKKLWQDRPLGENWIPVEDIGIRLVQDLFLIEDTVLLESVLDSLKAVRINPILRPPRKKVNSILIKIAKGIPLKDGVKELLSVYAYQDAIDLLEGLKLDTTGMALLGKAYYLAFENGDSVSALKLNQLFKNGLKDIGLFIDFYKKFTPNLATEINPNRLPKELIRGYVEASISLNQTDSALTILKRFGLTDQDLLFNIYLREGVVDSAYKHMDFKNPWQIYSLARKLFEEGIYDLSVELVERVNLPGFSIDKRAKELALRSAIELGDEDLILKFADILEKTYGKDSLTVYGRAMVKLKQDPQWVVLRLYTKSDPASMQLKARALLNSGHERWAFMYADFDDRVKFIKGLKESDVVPLLELPVPQDPSLILEYIELLWEKEHIKLATLLADSAVARGLVSKDAVLRVKGESMLREGDIDGALSQIDLIKEPKEKALLFYKIGIHLMKIGKLEQAKSMFFKAIQWGDAETRGYGAFKLATTLFQEKRYEESAEYYLMALELVQSDSLLRLNALHNLAICYKKMDKTDLVLDVYNRVIEKYMSSEESLEAFISRGLLLMEMGKPREAYYSFKEVEGEVINEDTEIELQFWMAQAAAMVGNYADALTHYQRLYSFHPDAGQWLITAKVETAKILTMLGHHERALTLYSQLLNTLSKDDPLYGEVEKAMNRLKTNTK